MTHLHLGTTELQVGEHVELEFVTDEPTDMEAVLKAIIAVHHYEEPVIHFHQTQTTGADHNPNSENRNRWWHEKEA